MLILLGNIQNFIIFEAIASSQIEGTGTKRKKAKEILNPNK